MIMLNAVTFDRLSSSTAGLLDVGGGEDGERCAGRRVALVARDALSRGSQRLGGAILNSFFDHF
jgi:hypothetical protein